MRLSAELLGSCEQRQNALEEREILLRGLAIPAIEHLGVTRDAYDAMDFSDNRVGRLDNFPRLLRLVSLNISGNVVESIDAVNLNKNLPNLKHLDLSYNQISSLYQVSQMGKGCPKLEFLSLNGNAVTRRQHYRLYTIKHIPTLKSLDFTKISKTERETADRLANSAAGAALESDVQQEKDNTTKTFVPGEGRSAEESFVTNFTPEQKELIRQMVAKAASPAEIEAIESSVRRGVLPTAAQLPATTTTPTTATATTNGDSRKRSASENGADDSNSGGEGAAKKTRVEEESPPEIEEETEEKEEDEDTNEYRRCYAS